MKILLILVSSVIMSNVVFSSTVYAGGYSGWAVPTVIEQVNGGLLVYGNFNDVNQCSSNMPVFVNEDPNNPNFLPTTSALLMMAVQAKSEVQFYLHRCTTVSFHWGQNSVINEAYTSGVYFKSTNNPVGVSPNNLLSRLEALESQVADQTPGKTYEVTEDLPTTLNVWNTVDKNTHISFNQYCGNTNKYIVVYIRSAEGAEEKEVAAMQCYHYNNTTTSFIVPAGWQYQFIGNTSPYYVVGYTETIE